MLAGGRGFGTEPPVTYTRSPEERFQTQLQQLQGMGFINASQNVRALLATGGMCRVQLNTCSVWIIAKRVESNVMDADRLRKMDSNYAQ